MEILKKPKYWIDLPTEISLLVVGKILIHILLVYLEINLLYSAEWYESTTEFDYEPSFIEQFTKTISSGYGLIFLFPLYQFVKVLFISSIINIGFTLYHINFSFKRLLWIVCVCEFILLIPYAYKIYYFTILHPEDYLRIHFTQFSFGTLLDFFNANHIVKPLFFVLQAINIWDLIYLLLAGYFIKKYHTISYDFAYKIVFNSYGVSYLAFIILGYLFLAS